MIVCLYGKPYFSIFNRVYEQNGIVMKMDVLMRVIARKESPLKTIEILILVHVNFTIRGNDPKIHYMWTEL